MRNAINESPRVAKPVRWRGLFRLSLRSLFVILTLAAIWLAVVFQRCREQRSAVARVLDLGGSVRYEHERDQRGRPIRDAALPGPPWLRRWLGPEFFQEVVDVQLDGKAVSDEDLRPIGKLRKLEGLHLNETKVGDAGLLAIRNCRRLRSLGLWESKVTDDGMRHLQGLRHLNSLVLTGTSVSDSGLVHVRALPRLQILSLGRTRVTSQGVAELHHHPTLTHLFLNETGIDDRAVAALASMNLIHLSLYGTAIDDRAVVALASMPKLLMLDVTDTGISGRGLQSLRESMPGCELSGSFVDLGGEPQQKYSETPKQWAALMEHVVALDREHPKKLVVLAWTNIQDDQLVALHRLKNVELIDLRGSAATAEGIDALCRALPQCEVRY